MARKNKKTTVQQHLDKLRANARKQISVAATVQFRVDEETMVSLMKAADQKKLPLGTLVRMWMVERLQSEGLTK